MLLGNVSVLAWLLASLAEAGGQPNVQYFHGIPIEMPPDDQLVQLMAQRDLAVLHEDGQTANLPKLFGAVVELDSLSHAQFLQDNANAVVLYYVPWCHWCNKFLPIYDELVGIAELALAPLQAGKLAFGKINLNRKENHPIMEQQGIMSYPTLKIHRERGNTTDSYEGEHDLRPVLRWLMEITTARMEIRKPEQLQAILGFRHSDVVAILVNPTPPMEAAWTKAQKLPEMGHVMFGLARDPNVSSYILNTFESADPATTDDRKRAAHLRSSPNLPYVALLNPHYYNDDQDKFVYDKSHLEYLAHIFPEKSGEEKKLTDEIQIGEFIRSYQYPTVARWSMSLAQKLLEGGRSFLIAFMHLNDTLEERIYEESEHELGAGPASRLLHVEDVLWTVGRQFRHKMVTVMSGINQFHERRIMSTLNIESTPKLVFVTMNPTGSGVFAPMLRYLAPEDIQDQIFNLRNAKDQPNDPKQAALSLGTWLDRIFAGSIDPNVKSEEIIPEDINQGPVRVLVGKTFDREIKKARDVLVDFYAPWCGHCRVFAPVYEKVAKAFKKAGVHTVMFAKMDATANEVPGLHLRGYPTILLYPADKKQTPTMNMGGNHDERQLVDWIATQVTHKFDPLRVHQALDSISEDDELPKLADEL